MAAPPGNPPRRYKRYWRHPWWASARRSPGFRRYCWKHGYVSPHFTRAEWACHDGTQVPDSLRSNAQRHAFNLERVRHEFGDQPMPPISLYRDPPYNRSIGGASDSRHMYADASNFSAAWVNETKARVGAQKYHDVIGRVFANGGVGSYPSGSVHYDSRGYMARWSSW